MTGSSLGSSEVLPNLIVKFHQIEQNLPLHTASLCYRLRQTEPHARLIRLRE